MGHIILGIILTAVGAILIIKTEWFINNFGRMSWFEEKLGYEGGSRLGYKLVGIVFLFVGIIVMTGSGTAFLQWLTKPLTRYSQK